MGAVVVMVRIAVVVAGLPLAVIDAGENVQVVSEGRPEQDKLIVPLKPVEFETDTELCPLRPGVVITTTAWLDGIAA